MNETNLQKWKVPFIAEIWKDCRTHFAIEKSCKIRLGEFSIFLEPIKEEKIAGYFLFQFSNPDNSVNSAESEAEIIKQNKFKIFKKILLLKGVKLEIKWEGIKPVDLPDGHRLAVHKCLPLRYEISDRPITFSENDIQSIESIYNKIQSHEKKQYIDNMLNLLATNTYNEKDSFFYKWVSFNQIYSYDSDDRHSERESIESFANRFSEFPESSQLIQKNLDFFTELSTKAHSNKKKTEDFSIELKKGIENENHSEIWKWSMLCIYSIRNEFFHDGKENEYFDKLSKLLHSIIIISLNNFFELK